MCRFKKNCQQIWIAVDGTGGRFPDFVIGDRSGQTAGKFWNKIKHHGMNRIAGNYRKPYGSIIPQEKHLQTKAETFTAEGCNSLYRHFLAETRRKSECCSKKAVMLEISVLLFMHYQNGTLNILN
ncbi:hypothetical protein Barb4_05065 [Bacteroidales bacterium Barb4]|nr:hypothetical protein Barb4_05065 [Bacteroidales bacterium Barb4]